MTARPIRALFLGGGTGGHLAPGIAVAEVLGRRGHASRFAIAGRAVERAMLSARGLAAEELFGDVGRPPPWQLGRWFAATARWRAAVQRFDPDVIVVLGGWVALPAAATGFFGRPSVLIEQNARPGKVARLLGSRVEHTCLAVDGDDMPRGRSSTRVTGNPVPHLPRRDRRDAARALDLDPDRRTLLVSGGSQGAADLNALTGALASVLAATGDPWQIFNITGSPADGELPRASACADASDVNGARAEHASAVHPASDLAAACASAEHPASDPRADAPRERVDGCVPELVAAARPACHGGPSPGVLTAAPARRVVSARVRADRRGARAAGLVAAGEPEVPVRRVGFVTDMASAWAAADLAVCRAGAGTVSELANTGTPAVLVPYPWHADRHQEANARRLVACGAAFVTPRDDPTGRRTAPALLRSALDRLDAMAAAARRLARPDAADQVADVVLRAAGA